MRQVYNPTKHCARRRIASVLSRLGRMSGIEISWGVNRDWSGADPWRAPGAPRASAAVDRHAAAEEARGPEPAISCHYLEACGDYSGNTGELRQGSTMLRTVAACVLLVLLASAVEAQRRTTASDDPGRQFRDCPICPEMVIVPAGEFLMGSPEHERGRGKDEGPQHRVVIKQPFAVGKFEVTFAQWDACVGEGGCAHKPGDEGWGRGRRPVINVSWNDAGQFVAWLSRKSGKRYRLLTEAEWEYAARAATKLAEAFPPFSTGATISYKQANYDANFVYDGGHIGIYRQRTLDVGSLPKNAFGLYDMHGNVWEWVEDCYRDSYAGAPTDGSAVTSSDCRLHILRGGAWNYHPQYRRAAYRYATPPGVRMENAGLRVARTL
jgi:formylglycine-generating enzyme required for sulfatase activity